jgi:hypothetical protein
MKYILIVALLLVLNGCASCSKPTFIKATPQNPPKEYKVEQTQLQTFIQILDKATIVINGCDNKLCGTIIPAVGTRVRLDKDILSVNQLDSAENKVYKISPIRYGWTCTKQKENDKVCTMSDTSPTGKPTKVVDDETRIIGNDIMVADFHTRSFDATQEFTGQMQYKASLFGKPTPNGAIQFSLTLLDEYILNTPTKIVKLPKIWVNDVQYSLPDFKLETVTEEFCYYPH